MRKYALLVLLVFAVNLAMGHPWKPSHYVIIDTDGGIDDMRAISILLASPDIRVMAITTSGGVLSPDLCYTKVKSLLKSYHHSGIPVGISRSIEGKNLELPVSIKWGDESGINPGEAEDAIEVIRKVIQAETSKVSFISLGSLKLIHEVYKSAPDLKEKMIQLIWSNSRINPSSGFNYNLSATSADLVLSDALPVIYIDSFENESIYSDEFLAGLSKINTRYADKIIEIFSNNPELDVHEFSRKATDDMIAVFLHFPNLFNKLDDNLFELSDDVDEKDIRECIQKILSGQTVNRNQVIKRLPVDTSFYFGDLQPYVFEIIEKHGMDEWSSGVLANELHRHLGIYAIIGVKMGILAREYFHIGVDDMNILSYAGSLPPLSCMNDGLLVSTGATPGHGLLSVIDDMDNSPVVEFTYKRNSIRITLLPEIYKEISMELREINYVHGLDSDIYWELVRQKTILYWKNLSRYEIFKIEKIN